MTDYQNAGIHSTTNKNGYSNPGAQHTQSRNSNGGGTYPNSFEITEADGMLSLDDARMFVGWLSESVTRAAQLSSKIEM